MPVTDDPIDGSSFASRDRDLFLSVSEIDTGHPALRNVDRFAGVQFIQAIHVNPTNSRVLARLNDQTPLVLEREVGEGRVLVFTSTFDNVANDLPVHAAWVPFVQQSAAYLSGGGAEEPVNLTVDSYVELRTGNQGPNERGAAEVLGPNDKRELTVDEATKVKNFQIPTEGFFEVKTASGRHSLIAANADRRESDLTTIPPETLDLWKGTGVGDNSSNAASGQENQEDKKPWGLWPYLLLLLLGVAVAESLVADRYLRPPADEPVKRKEAA